MSASPASRRQGATADRSPATAASGQARRRRTQKPVDRSTSNKRAPPKSEALTHRVRRRERDQAPNPSRFSRTIARSRVDMRERTAIALARSLPRCPCCARLNKRGAAVRRLRHSKSSASKPPEVQPCVPLPSHAGCAEKAHGRAAPLPLDDIQASRMLGQPE